MTEKESNSVFFRQSATERGAPDGSFRSPMQVSEIEKELPTMSINDKWQISFLQTIFSSLFACHEFHPDQLTAVLHKPHVPGGTIQQD